MEGSMLGGPHSIRPSDSMRAGTHSTGRRRRRRRHRHTLSLSLSVCLRDCGPTDADGRCSHSNLFGRRLVRFWAWCSEECNLPPILNERSAAANRVRASFSYLPRRNFTILNCKATGGRREFVVLQMKAFLAQWCLGAATESYAVFLIL